MKARYWWMTLGLVVVLYVVVGWYNRQQAIEAYGESAGQVNGGSFDSYGNDVTPDVSVVYVEMGWRHWSPWYWGRSSGWVIDPYGYPVYASSIIGRTPINVIGMGSSYMYIDQRSYTTTTKARDLVRRAPASAQRQAQRVRMVPPLNPTPRQVQKTGALPPVRASGAPTSRSTSQPTSQPNQGRTAAPTAKAQASPKASRKPFTVPTARPQQARPKPAAPKPYKPSKPSPSKTKR